MLVKILITGTLHVETGMHIGGSTAFSAIGAVDAPVIKDTKTGLPMLPGSSLKGKLRTLLAKAYNEKVARNPDEDDEKLTDLFGSAKENKRSRILFYDALMDNWEELKAQGLSSRTEVKFENTINRLTAVANPRQIERVVRGSTFPLKLVYELYDLECNPEKKKTQEDLMNQLKEDIRILCSGFKLLQYDYLGGHGSRGYGKVSFSNMELEVPVGEISLETEAYCQKLLSEI